MNHVAHFAIHADDVERARTFYEQVFGWTFKPWGPPNFYMIATGSDDARPHGSLQERSEPLSGTGMSGWECTVSVDDVDAIAKAIVKAGGTVTMAPVEIPQVGRVLQFGDTEGNRACAMQYADGMH